MRSWDSPPVPTLPGRGLPLRLHDTSTGQVMPTAPGPTARLYVCGITPYDATHLGHAATYLVFDLVQRVWLDAGHDVHYVQNVTDIDDPLLERAVQTGQDWHELALRETELFRQDMRALRVLAPRDYIGAVEAMPLIVRQIGLLREAGAVYELEGDLYFDVGADPLFGSVAGLDVHTMVALSRERGGDPDRPGKRHRLDPLLWLRARPFEPAWDTDLGHGRPGWHVECVAIALEHLGMAFDVQGGGRDLAFPHHEMGASHAQVATGRHPYARLYVHAGLVGLDGEKMSKSRGNLVFVSALRHDGIPPAQIRLALLAHHYRGDWQWADDDLDRSGARVGLWSQAFAAPRGPNADPVLARMRERLSDDLDAPGALRAVDHWATRTVAGEGADRAAPALVRDAVDALLGIRLA